MTRTLTIQTRVDPDLYNTLSRLCEMRGQSLSEYLRNALREALAGEKEVYKMLLKKEKTRK